MINALVVALLIVIIYNFFGDDDWHGWR